MCNRFRAHYGWQDWAEDFSETRISLVFPDALPNLLPELRPTDPHPVFRPIDAAAPMAGLEAKVMRWDLVPNSFRAPLKTKKFLTTNARSETVGTTSAFREPFARRRCLVPADGFFEWTGEKGRKTKWLITVADQRCFCFAGIWDHAETADGPIDSFTILTTAAGPDMQPIHDRQPVILPRDRWHDWLDLSGDTRPLYEPGPLETLRAELAPAERAASGSAGVRHSDSGR
jgi:putative SOS response-associated peptidase YedK